MYLGNKMLYSRVLVSQMKNQQNNNESQHQNKQNPGELILLEHFQLKLIMENSQGLMWTAKTQKYF